MKRSLLVACALFLTTTTLLSGCIWWVDRDEERRGYREEHRRDHDEDRRHREYDEQRERQE